MAKKVKLLFTLATLTALSIPVLTQVIKEVDDKIEVPAEVTQEALVAMLLKVAEPAPEPVAETPASTSKVDSFTYKGTKYRALMPKVNIPGIGLRTALELATDKEALEYLIKNGCVGSVIAEV